MGSMLGVLKIAAGRRGLSLDEYLAEIASGRKWCTACKQWKLRKDFNADNTRGDKLATLCRVCHSNKGKAKWVIKPRVKGRRFIAPRDGDVRQARGRVHSLVRIGLLAKANNLPCNVCGHICTHGERRHEFHHTNGYSADNHELVEVVCTTCHRERDKQRKEVNVE